MLLELNGIAKSFLGVRVLDGVSLQLQPGEVHAVVGENGAGKSTLMKIASGVYPPDAGTIHLGGGQVSFRDPRQAQAAGIGIIHQEFNLLPDRTVAENVFLGREPVWRGLVDQRAMNARTAELLASVGEESLSPQAMVGRLGVARQQVVEIVKALALDARVLIMDEPTASLADHEVELLYALVRRLQERGIGILYVSHRLTEVFDLSSRITVLKDGRLVTTLDTPSATPEMLVKHMVGRDLAHYYPPRASAGAGSARVVLSNAGNRKLHGIDLELKSGEVLGVAGLQGSGRSALARALFGVDGFTDGELLIDGQPVRLRSPRQAVRAGIAYVTEDRKGEGLALGQSVLDNAMLTMRAVTPAWLGRRNGRGGRMKKLLAEVKVQAASDEQEIRYLSGGNQQKVILARWLAMKPRVLLFDEPTRGIDVGAKAAIHDLIRQLATDGTAVLMISSELPELLGMSDRIVVMRDGRLAGELPAGSAEEAVVGLATGAGAV